MTDIKQYSIVFRGAILCGLLSMLTFMSNRSAQAQGESTVRERMNDLFSTKTIDINVLDEQPASLSTEKEFNDEAYPEDEMEPVEPDELQLLSGTEIQECAVRFSGVVNVKVITDPRATMELNQNDVIAIKINARHKGVRLQIAENIHATNSSEYDRMGSFVRGVCVFTSKSDTRVNLSLSNVVLDQLALLENGLRTVTSVHVEHRSKLVNVAQENKNPKSMLTIMGEGLYECPSVRKERFRCISG